MKVLLVDADSQKGFPNLALMKLSSDFKNTGSDVDLLKGIPDTAPLVEYDAVYISCIFFQNKDAVLDYANQFSCKVTIGGSGSNNDSLPHHIEHIMPDYSLYGIDFSMGFTSRG
ncbi:MAG: radical SAM protein, partial [Candidatus Thorarchaeota archaeon]